MRGRWWPWVSEPRDAGVEHALDELVAPLEDPPPELRVGGLKGRPFVRGGQRKPVPPSQPHVLGEGRVAENLADLVDSAVADVCAELDVVGHDIRERPPLGAD